MPYGVTRGQWVKCVITFCVSIYKIFFTEKNCDAILKAGGAERLCSRLMDSDPSGQLLFRSSDILWNLLENGDPDEVGHQLKSLTCVG